LKFWSDCFQVIAVFVSCRRDALNEDTIRLYGPNHQLSFSLKIKLSKKLTVNVAAGFFHVRREVYCFQP